MSDVKDPVRPNYNKSWVRGEEYVSQEGSSLWTQLREGRGWTMEDVEQLTDGHVPVPVQMMYEDYPGYPDIFVLVSLAIIYDTTPGGLLDTCFIMAGNALKDDES